MRPRKADASKPPTAKKTPPARKTAAKAPPAASPPDLEVAILKTVETKRGCAGRLKQAKKNETTPPADSKAPKSSGRGFGRVGHHFNRATFQPDRHFYRGGRGQTGRMGFPNEYDFDYPYEFHGQGGRRGSFRDGRYGFGGGAPVAAPPSRPYTDRTWHDAPDRGYGMHIPPRRHPYSPGQFDGPFMGGHFDEPYFYNDNAHGIKRPFHMRDYDYDYSEPSSCRPRLDYTDPAASFHGNHYRDTYGARNSVYPHDYCGPGYNSGPYSSYFEGNHSYAGGRYY